MSTYATDENKDSGIERQVTGTKSGVGTDAPDSVTCGRCGESIRLDGDDERRHRVELIDSAESSATYLFEKMCSECWWSIHRFATEGRA